MWLCCRVLLFYDASFLLNINSRAYESASVYNASYIFFMLYDTKVFFFFPPTPENTPADLRLYDIL